MPIVLPAVLRCDGGCGTVASAEILFHSKTNLELRAEESWTVEQGGMVDYGEGIWHKVWCAACQKQKEQRQ